MPFPAQPALEPSRLLRRFFDSMLREYGPQRWWPARTRLEVILGAILTQNTSWNNAARAIKGLRKAELLSLARLKRASQPELEAAIRSAGFYKQKARTIRNFLDWLNGTCEGLLSSMFKIPPLELRDNLLGIKGLGPETVDAILLYSGGIPTFVADAYTRRILARHSLLSEDAGYKEARQFIHSHLPADPQLFNEFHALLVEAGKRHCRRAAPDCEACPLERFLPKEFRAEQVLRRDSTSVRRSEPKTTTSLPYPMQG